MKLHPRAAFYFMLQNLTAWVFGSVMFAFFLNGHATKTPGLGVQWRATGDFGSAVLIGFLVLAVILFGISLLRAGSYQIDLKKEGVALSYGVISKTNEILLFNKIQDIQITRSALERLLGLSTLVIQNAMGKPESIPGLGADTAEAFRDSIVSRTARPA